MITIEKINGKDYTVVWHDARPTGYLRSSMAGGGYLFFATCGELKLDCHIATALPALPRNPKSDEATRRLLHLYRAHGLIPIMSWETGNVPPPNDCELRRDVAFGSGDFEDSLLCADEKYDDYITHATFNGERVEIAIEGDE